MKLLTQRQSMPINWKRKLGQLIVILGCISLLRFSMPLMLTVNMLMKEGFTYTLIAKTQGITKADMWACANNWRWITDKLRIK